MTAFLWLTNQFETYITNVESEFAKGLETSWLWKLRGLLPPVMGMAERELSGVMLCVGVVADSMESFGCDVVDLWLSSFNELCRDVSSSDLMKDEIHK